MNSYNGHAKSKMWNRKIFTLSDKDNNTQDKQSKRQVKEKGKAINKLNARHGKAVWYIFANRGRLACSFSTFLSHTKSSFNQAEQCTISVLGERQVQ